MNQPQQQMSQPSQNNNSLRSGNVRDEETAQKQKEIIKRAVKDTFEELEKIERTQEELQKKKSALKRDLSDLAEGRIDRIVERHGMDVVSREISVFKVIPKVEIVGKTISPWYVPYIMVFDKTTTTLAPNCVCVNNSVAKINAKGSYVMNNGEVKYL